MTRAAFALLAAVAAIFIAVIAAQALATGHESGVLEAAQIGAAIIATLATATALRRENALSRCAVVFGFVLVSTGFILDEASQAMNDAAALPLASAGFYLLALGWAAAAYELVVRRREYQR